MKKLIFTHLFLNLYLLVLIQPALPIIEYFVNYDYITSKLCENIDKPILTCNGKCYLEKQVVQQLDIDHNQEIPLPPKVDLEKFITIKSNESCYNLIDENLTHKNPDFSKPLEDRIILHTLFRPPIV
ncbi:MAG: hypothetical protein OEM04_10895 [Flavobacteriaceae bacterium]|nr:hypothetical protein [Flavobacteriaceae bacterium]